MLDKDLRVSAPGHTRDDYFYGMMVITVTYLLEILYVEGKRWRTVILGFK